MNEEFEKQLQRQPLRELPREWRSGILAEAQLNVAAAADPPIPSPRAVGRWPRRGDFRPAGVSAFLRRFACGISTWLWPNQRAWAGLAFAWAVILFFHFTNPDDLHSTGGSFALTFRPAPFLQQQTLLMTQLSGPWDSSDAPAAPPAPPKPRSERPRRQLIG